MNITRSEIEEVEALADKARGLDYEETRETTEAQLDALCDAENDLFEVVEALLPEEAFEKLLNYCLKATTLERINAAVDFVRGYSE